MDSRLLFPSDDDDRPDVHHQGGCRDWDVCIEVECVFWLVDFNSVSLIHCKCSTSSKMYLNKSKIYDIFRSIHNPVELSLEKPSHHFFFVTGGVLGEGVRCVRSCSNGTQMILGGHGGLFFFISFSRIPPLDNRHTYTEA